MPITESPEEIPDKAKLLLAYEESRESYSKLQAAMEERLRSALEKDGLSPLIKGRIKSFDSWYEKRIRLLRNARSTGKPPIPITDVVALRIVCPFLGDLSAAEGSVCAAFSVIEVDRKGSERSFREFGYESIHLLIALPEELKCHAPGLDLPVVEVQLRTILQEAWAEVEHELVYKAEFTPFDEPMKRKLAALNANLSLSDTIFQEILDYQKKLNSQLERRRSSFYGKIEAAIDLVPVDSSGEYSKVKFERREFGKDRANATTIDDLLLSALSAHNREDYESAIRIYGVILDQKPGKEIKSVVIKHRGMAYFSQSLYREAVDDFTASLALNPQDHKAAYYRGVVKSVLQDYEASVADFDLALSIHPYHFYSLYRRAVSYWHLGDFAQALADAESALRLEPGNAQALQIRNLSLKKMRM